MKEKTKDPIIFTTVQGLEAFSIILLKKMDTLYVKRTNQGTLNESEFLTFGISSEIRGRL